MKSYTRPEIEIELFKSIDVIAYSAPTPTEPTQPGTTAPGTDPFIEDAF